jgi:ABC-type Zn uptake system ZnuABC Zn-binding protein ZnuA
VILLLSRPASAAAADPTAPIPVVATIPVLKDFAEQIGGGRVQVVSLLSGLENEHTYSPKPSDMLALKRARALLQIGAGLEVWIAPLVKNAASRDLLVVTTSNGIALIREHEVPADDGPGHEGNPHVWLDPENAKVMLRHITDAFIKLDPGHAGEWRARHAAYLKRLDALESELTERMRQVKTRDIIVHHPAWPYLARRFGIRIAGVIVTQPGAEPSAQHLQALMGVIRKRQVRVIVSEPQLNKKIPAMLAAETGARVVVLSPLQGGVPGTESYLEWLRYTVTQLAAALE